MGQFILFAENRATGQGDAPSAAAIESALQGIPVIAARAARAAQGLLDNGGFVGSSRITRQAVLNLTGPNRITRVAWLYEYAPGPATWTPAQQAGREQTVREYIRLQADDRLRAQGPGWQPVQILSYNPATNGDRAWWDCTSTPRNAQTCAAATRTRNAFDLAQQTGGTSTLENPTGPDLVDPPPDYSPVTGGGANSPLNQARGLLSTLAWVAGGIAVLYVAGPLLREVSMAGATSLRTRRRAQERLSRYSYGF